MKTQAFNLEASCQIHRVESSDIKPSVRKSSNKFRNLDAIHYPSGNTLSLSNNLELASSYAELAKVVLTRLYHFKLQRQLSKGTNLDGFNNIGSEGGLVEWQLKLLNPSRTSKLSTMIFHLPWGLAQVIHMLESIPNADPCSLYEGKYNLTSLLPKF
ncbi:hypothetical protein QQP08_014555 [Theobroma cacao]|uniref:Uncharacterized protein n=1 Tax=Theobroma cacao TaxID=3641 RepID=A0A061EL28_THECC|nr:Uncharacterized protein TCM_020535 [Theobroma cacao]WRX22068.1 hypothetical protein QQP08_014555 [Theobroma cacao]